jgi:hypothetical protein
MGNPLEEDYTPEPKAADQLRQTVRTLRKWRQLGLGPPWIKVGQRIYYSNVGMAAWLKSLERTPVRSHRAV